MKMKNIYKLNVIKSSPFLKHSLALLLMLAIMLVMMKPVAAETVNINKADVQVLQQSLQGVGPVKAQAIVDYRKKKWTI